VQAGGRAGAGQLIAVTGFGVGGVGAEVTIGVGSMCEACSMDVTVPATQALLGNVVAGPPVHGGAPGVGQVPHVLGTAAISAPS